MELQNTVWLTDAHVALVLLSVSIHVYTFEYCAELCMGSHVLPNVAMWSIGGSNAVKCDLLKECIALLSWSLERTACYQL